MALAGSTAQQEDLKSRSPASGSWQVINDCIGVKIERGRIHAGRTAPEIKAAETFAVFKRSRRNHGNAVGNLHTGQEAVIRESRRHDVRDCVGDQVAATPACGEPNERGLTIVEQDSIHIAIGGIAGIHGDRGQTETPIKRIGSNVGDTAAD